MQWVLFFNFIKIYFNLTRDWLSQYLILKKIDYVRFTPNKQDIKDSTCLKNQINYRLPNVPEVFEEKYFSKKEVENLLELKDIIDYLWLILL